MGKENIWTLLKVLSTWTSENFCDPRDLKKYNKQSLYESDKNFPQHLMKYIVDN